MIIINSLASKLAGKMWLCCITFIVMHLPACNNSQIHDNFCGTITNNTIYSVEYMHVFIKVSIDDKHKI